MLLNPNWNKNAFELSSLIAWLETKDPKEKYRYTHNEGCLLAQYFAAMGFEKPFMTPNFVIHGNNKWRAIPHGWDWIAICGERTFGDALARARTLVPEKTVG